MRFRGRMSVRKSTPLARASRTQSPSSRSAIAAVQVGDPRTAWVMVCEAISCCTGQRRIFSISSEPYRDRKSTRLNSSHLGISYAVFCLKKKNTNVQAELDGLYKDAGNLAKPRQYYQRVLSANTKDVTATLDFFFK